MSRIHEALQRAYLERGNAPALGEIQVVDREVSSSFEEAPAPAPAPKPKTKTQLVIEDVAQHAWSPSVASLPTLADRGIAVEQFRSLRSRVYQARYESPLKTILIASGMPSEGKSFIASNLAISLARNSIHNILLIDGDLRRPTLHTLLGAPNASGLGDYLAGTAELNEVMQRNSTRGSEGKSGEESLSNLTLISSGKVSENSSELVANRRIEELITSAAPYFDWIVIDAPPVLAVTDAVELSRAADAVLLIARGAKTPYEVSQRAKAAFGSSRILGFVLNDVNDRPRHGSYNYNYYYNDSGAGEKAKRPLDSVR
jgi:capsular exopolysaccharide synthesis family protein